MNRIAIGLVWAVGLGGLVGCVDGPVDSGNLVDEDKPSVDQTKPETIDAKQEAWGSADAPGIFGGTLEYNFAKLPTAGEAANIPWAGNYWPVYQDSINDKWDGANSQSPSAKYGQAFGVTGIEDAVSKAHGIDAQTSRKACTTNADCTSLKDGSKCAMRPGKDSGRCIPTWWGICHAWAPAAILVAEPKYPVTLNGVDFKVQDVKALVTLAHNSTNTKFVSLRCDLDLEAGSEIHFDDYGRPTGDSKECADTNAATLHILLANYLGVQKQSFVEDRTFDDEVWNQPIRGCKVLAQKDVTALEANKLIGVGPQGGVTTKKTGSVAKDAWALEGSVDVKAGETLTVSMKGTGDADLYVRFGAEPTAQAYDCRPYKESTVESCSLTVPASATKAFIGVNGYAATSEFELTIVAGGAVPSTYVFNPQAVKFVSVKTEVSYISESPASTDGHLGATIDQYTHKDTYEYVLELDTNGKIIGGEWVGDSKTSHPDFLWLPLSVGSQSVAGGKITYAKVKQIYDLSMQAPGGGGGGGTEKTVTESATLAKGAWKQYGPFQATGNFTVTMTGTGDADLYVRKNAAPTLTQHDCRPYQSGSAESCTLVGGGQFYVGVYGYAATSAVELKIVYAEGTGGGTTPTEPPATVVHLDATGTVAAGEMKVYTVNVIAGQKIVVKTTSTVDVDLYIQMGAAPTTAAYLARGYTDSGNETVTYTTASSGTLHVGVHGYAAGSFTVKTSN